MYRWEKQTRKTQPYGVASLGNLGNRRSVDHLYDRGANRARPELVNNTETFSATDDASVSCASPRVSGPHNRFIRDTRD